MTRLTANLLLTLTALIWGTAFVAQNLGMQDIGRSPSPAYASCWAP